MQTGQQAMVDYSEVFQGDTEALSYHLVQEHHTKLKIEAQWLTASGKATMQCDLSKRDKHG